MQDPSFWSLYNVQILVGTETSLATVPALTLPSPPDLTSCGSLGADPSCNLCNSQCYDPLRCPGSTIPNCKFQGPCCLDPNSPDACNNLVCL
eukprot:jgi/Botrbrau1/5159/Bobra.0172s0031.1